LFATSYVHWLEAGDKADLALISESVMSLLASIVPTNATPPGFASEECSGFGFELQLPCSRAC
jgi:hypothetical protein